MESTVAPPLRVRTSRRLPLWVFFAFCVVVGASFLGTAGAAEGADTTGTADEDAQRARIVAAREGKAPATRETATLLDTLVDELLAKGAADARECIELATRAVSLRERLQGPRHADLGESLVRLSAAERAGSRFDDARKHGERALSILVEARGRSHESVSRARMSLATLYTDLANYERARTMFAEEIAALEHARSTDHPDLAKALYGAARVARRAGDYREAEALYLRALAIGERELDGQTLLVAFVLNGLANLRDDQARYPEALELYERALRIGEKKAGPDHPFVTACINNTALVMKKLGDLDGASRHLRRALEIERRTRKSDHAHTASALANLAELEGLRGNPDEALALAREARAMRTRIYGTMHPEVAGSLRLEAMLERERGNATASVRLFEEALVVADSTLGHDHAEVADVLGGLAASLLQAGDIPRARATQERAVATCEKGVGSEDPRTADALRALAAIRFLGHDSLSAMRAAQRAEGISREHARLVVGALSESEALRYSEQCAAARDLLLTLFAMEPRVARVDDVWNAVTRSRSLVLDEIAARHRSLAAERSDKVRSLSQQYAAASRALAELLVAGPAADVAIYRAAVDESRRRRDKIERQLATQSKSFRARRTQERVDLAGVRAAMPIDCALVAYSRYDHGVTAKTMSPGYMAFVLRPGKPAFAVSLGAAEAIEREAEAWAAAVSEPDSAAGGAGPFARSARRAGEELRRRVWDPVASHVGDARTVLVVPDGALHRINLAALPRRGGGFLLDAGTRFHSLLAERDIAIQPRGRAGVGRGLLVVGGVDFDPAAAVAGSAPPAKPRFHFEALPATSKEAASVADQWSKRRGATKDAKDGAFVLMGAGASEDAVKRLAPGRRALHLATHGVFVDSEKSAPRRGARGIGGLGSDGSPPPATAATSFLPVAGLAFAGANSSKAAGGTEDGILTAEEIAALDLSGTEWAVLSACDTGRGEVRPGEGVLGLRRAFEVTGVETLILSLWSVDDESTRRWMDALYEARLARGLATLESVDAANRAVLAERRARGASEHPFYWAAFVAAGEWR